MTDEVSLRYKPEPKKKKPKGKSESKQGGSSESEESKVLEKQLFLISKKFGLHLSGGEQNHFSIALLSMYAKESESAKSPTLKKVLDKIEERTEGGAVLKTIFIKKGVIMAWMVARKLSSQFASAERVLDGILTKDVKMIATGTLHFFIPDTGEEIEGVHWLLEEISASEP